MSHDIISLLRDASLKKTPLRIAILEVFLLVSRPLLITDLQSLLEEKGYIPNITSLYRQMEALEEKGVVQSVQLQKKGMYYEMQSHHHHHFICEECDVIECVEDSELEKNIHALEEMMKRQGKTISHHHFSLSGYCKNCV